MGALAVLAVVGGFVQVPQVDRRGSTSFLEPDVRRLDRARRADHDGPARPSASSLGAVLGLARHRVAYRVWVAAARARRRSVQARFGGLHRLFVNKWYFDELIDVVVVAARSRGSGASASRPSSASSSTARSSAATTGIVRAGSAAVRALQSGFLRAYAALLLVGLAAVALYFLLQSA